MGGGGGGCASLHTLRYRLSSSALKPIMLVDLHLLSKLAKTVGDSPQDRNEGQENRPRLGMCHKNDQTGHTLSSGRLGSQVRAAQSCTRPCRVREREARALPPAWAPIAPLQKRYAQP